MSRWYPHTIGLNHGKWYWITHPTFDWVCTAGEPDEEDCDWDTVSQWNGPFDSWDSAADNMADANGNAGSYDGPSNELKYDMLSSKLCEQMTKDNKVGYLNRISW